MARVVRAALRRGPCCLLFFMATTSSCTAGLSGVATIDCICTMLLLCEATGYMVAAVWLTADWAAVATRVCTHVPRVWPGYASRASHRHGQNQASYDDPTPVLQLIEIVTVAAEAVAGCYDSVVIAALLSSAHAGEGRPGTPVYNWVRLV